MKLKTLIILLFIVTLPALLNAQNDFKVFGKVYDKGSGETLPIVKVLILNKSKPSGIFTDFDGFYEVELNKRVAKIEFSFIGYETQIIEIKFDKNKEMELNVYLKPSSIGWKNEPIQSNLDLIGSWKVGSFQIK